MMKLRADLGEVVDKVRLCRDMLPVVGAGGEAADRDDALLDVLGFLEACGARIHELIEAGTVGLLEEDLLELCLKVNDALHRTLDAERVYNQACINTCFEILTGVYLYICV
jgi:hypothetical protein